MLIGKMDKDYTTYSADQLLNDDFFIQSELHPTEKSRAFWSDLQIKSAALSQEIENARLFLHTIKIDRNCSSLAAKDEHALWQRIELKNKETERKAKRKQFIRLAISTVASSFVISNRLACHPAAERCRNRLSGNHPSQSGTRQYK